MRLLAVLAIAVGASAQQPPFTLDRVLSSAFPAELTAAPAGGKVAWVSNAKGVRNIMVAGPPDYRARKITAYTADDGQEMGSLAWTPDATAIVYVRGESANRAGEYPNPALDPNGAEQDLWIVALGASAPRKIGEGRSPAVSPRGGAPAGTIAFIRRGQLWWAPLDGKTAPSQAFKGRGQCSGPVWSPDGARLAFVSGRGDHSLIGVFDPAAPSLRYLDPSTDSDIEPEWSPDGRGIAFIRIPSSGLRAVRQPHRSGEPWSIRVVNLETGEGREIWRASPGPGSVFREATARNQLLWADGGRIVFPWEGDGWTHLYSIPAGGGKPTLLTPGAFEVEDVALAAGKREVVFSSNQGDTDRRHLWKVAVAGGTPVALTSGPSLEWSPAPPRDGAAPAVDRGDAPHPPPPPLVVGQGPGPPPPATAPPPRFSAPTPSTPPNPKFWWDRAMPCPWTPPPSPPIFHSSTWSRHSRWSSPPPTASRFTDSFSCRPTNRLSPHRPWSSSTADRAARCCSAGTTCTTIPTPTRSTSTSPTAATWSFPSIFEAASATVWISARR